MLKEIRLIDDKFVAIICGSFRRNLPSSGDIDLLLTHPNFVSNFSTKEIHQTKRITRQTKLASHLQEESISKKLLSKVVNKLIDVKFIVDTFSFGDAKYSVNKNFK